jgi:hypothetical protein
LKNGTFAVLAKVEPPKGADAAPLIKTATRIKGRVDAVLVPEMNHAVMHMSALGVPL